MKNLILRTSNLVTKLAGIWLASDEPVAPKPKEQYPMNNSYIYICNSGYVVGRPEPSVKEAMDEAAWLGYEEGTIYEIVCNNGHISILTIGSVIAGPHAAVSRVAPNPPSFPREDTP